MLRVVFPREATLREGRVALEDYPALFAGLQQAMDFGMSPQDRELALVGREGDVVFGQLVCHFNHIFCAVVRHADGLGHAGVDAFREAFGNGGDGAGVDVAVDEVDVDVIKAETLQRFLEHFRRRVGGREDVCCVGDDEPFCLHDELVALEAGEQVRADALAFAAAVGLRRVDPVEARAAQDLPGFFDGGEFGGRVVPCAFVAPAPGPDGDVWD